jgi:hypothetical protein
MHYVFKSKADADLLMMAPSADQILRIIGHEPSPKGIVEVAALPEAIAAIEIAISAEIASTADAEGDSDDASRGDGHVSLRRRAWPMLEMMKRSLAERADIVWGV